MRHAHPHCHVLLKVDGEDTSFLVGDEVVRLTDESAVLINAWTPHAYVHDPRKPRTIILALYIEPSWLAEFRPNWMASGSSGFFTRLVGGTSEKIRKMTLALASSMVHTPTASADHEAQLGALMVAVIEHFTDWRNVGDSLRSAVANSLDWRVSKAVRAIRDDPGGVDNMDHLAEIAGMSRANFFRVFEASTGVTPRVFLNMIRVEQAVTVATGSDTMTRYAHLSAVPEDLAQGQRVAAGDVIGRVGATGTATGPNLHYEVLVDGRPTDPLSDDRLAEAAESDADDTAALSSLAEARTLLNENLGSEIAETTTERL